MAVFDWLRNESWKDLLEGIAFFGLILGIPTGGAGFFIVIPVGLLLIILKIGIEAYDKVQTEIDYTKNWALLENRVISLSDKKYFEMITSLLEEFNDSKKPIQVGSELKWEYLHQNPAIALKVYTIIASLDENIISPRRRAIKTLSIIGFTKLENSFQHVFQVFERTNNKKAKYGLAETLANISSTAQTRSLFVFIEYVLKDYSSLRAELMEDISYRAQDFNQNEIQKILKLAPFPYQSEQAEFYLRRTRYFFAKAFDSSTNKFRGMLMYGS